MMCSSKWTTSTAALFSLTILALVLGGSRALADDDKEAVKQSAGSYLSAERKINVTRFDPARPGPHPAVLLLHGTDGADKCAETYQKVASRLAVKGYVVFVVRYFDCFGDRPKELAFFRDNVKGYLTMKKTDEQERVKAGFKDCLTTVCDGVRYVREQPGLKKDRVGLVGFSLGAFLALSAATREELEVAAVVDLFGGLPEEMQPQVKNLPPVLIVHGDKDQIVPVSTANDLHKMLKEKSIEHEIKVYKGVGHLFDTGEGQFDWLAAASAESCVHAFLKKHLQKADK
jgi:carboxymethylenebutenolidase